MDIQAIKGRRFLHQLKVFLLVINSNLNTFNFRTDTAGFLLKTVTPLYPNIVLHWLLCDSFV